MPAGGYQRPTNPAPVSGPGKASQRTDGGPGQPRQALTDAAYGEQATYQADQAGAPMAATPTPGTQGPAAPPVDLSQVTPLNAPTQQPGMPVTAGADSGAGPGMAALGMSAPQNDPGYQSMQQLIPMFELAANLPSSSFQFRQFVRRLRAGAA